MLFNGMLATYPSVKGGRLRGLAVTSVERVPSAPDLPTVAESGMPGFVTGSYQGLLAAAGTPREVIAKLNTELTRILNTQEMKDRLDQRPICSLPALSARLNGFCGRSMILCFP